MLSSIGQTAHNLYRIDIAAGNTSANATLLGRHNLSNVNALGLDDSGNVYAGKRLRCCIRSTKQQRLRRRYGIWDAFSSGDLTFYNDDLYAVVEDADPMTVEDVLIRVNDPVATGNIDTNVGQFDRDEVDAIAYRDGDFLAVTGHTLLNINRFNFQVGVRYELTGRPYIVGAGSASDASICIAALKCKRRGRMQQVSTRGASGHVNPLFCRFLLDIFASCDTLPKGECL